MVRNDGVGGSNPSCGTKKINDLADFRRSVADFPAEDDILKDTCIRTAVNCGSQPRRARNPAENFERPVESAKAETVTN